MKTRVKIIVTVIEGSYEESAAQEFQFGYGTYASDAMKFNTVIGDMEHGAREEIENAKENDKA